ncbi:dolichol kinase [Halomicrobium salinisoli]|uniref:dolichol kinase n=1 Tax=Halomicrobium salinisoli TaxID=2878391 RepID=UPI001CF032D6|nr:dolichol kinase [Halomicrobium salinisoli]
MPDEVARRLVHASTTAVPLSYVLLEPVTWDVLRALLAVALVAGLALEVVRLFVGLDWRIFDRLTREYEEDNLAGYFLGAVGMAVVVFAFPPPPQVAVPAMLMLTIADPVSGLLSSGQLKTAKEGYVLLATFGVATLLAAPFVPPAAAVLGGIAATVADGVKPVIRGYVIDDNLTIPISAAVVMYATLTYLPAGLL